MELQGWRLRSWGELGDHGGEVGVTREGMLSKLRVTLALASWFGVPRNQRVNKEGVNTAAPKGSRYL